ncbi:hypothetical protein EI982_14415 [Haloplanus rallus]|uniref:PGF-CTERM sorting domain-containing protein n=1 Tax=Haloplanus rallus TaxID=1816183 RepID=A0A6B9FBS7_9EURY|nr:hypothetical protein [Haloplanus rallus]QGX95891.1 hypothetical protein EI982_14415 [Haloplanus rallus]
MIDRRGTLPVVGLTALVLVAVPAAGAGVGFGEANVSPTAVSTGATTTVDLSVNATGVNTGDGTTGANVTVSAPAALDLSGATTTASATTPNATGVTATVDAGTNAVVVSWDDDGGIATETVSVSVSVDGVAVGRTGDHEVTATVDADGDGTTDASGTVGTVTATATDSDRSVTTAGSTLYLGEEDVDLTGLDGAARAGEDDRFYGVGGDAEGGVATVDDAATADVSLGNGFTAGTYAFAAGGPRAFSVDRPNVTAVELYVGDTASGTEVSGSSVPRSVGTLTVDPTFDFAAADEARVTVEDGDGLNLTGELVDDPTVASDDGTVTMDVSELSTGTYTIRVEGATDLDHVNGSTTVRIRPEARTVSLSRTRVVHGESTVATVSGAPGATRYVRLSGDALRDGQSVTVPTANAVFGGAEGLVFVDADDAANVIYAVVSLDEDGFARVKIGTDRLAEGDHDVAVARDATADDEATVPLTVADRDVSVTPARSTLAVGETVTVSGTARGADDVKLYAAVGGEYAPLYEDDDELAEARVRNDGSWTVDLDTRSVLTVPGRYRIVALPDPGDDRLGSTTRLSESTVEDVDDRGTTTVRTVDPSPSASASRSYAATGTDDDVRITGRAPGPAETVRLHVVGPRGAVDSRDVSVDDDDGFDVDYTAFDETGTYRLLVVTAGRDGTFGADGDATTAVEAELSGSETRREAIAILRDAYGGAGVDDRLVALNVTAADPRVGIAAVRERDGGLVVSGTSNRENGTVVLLDLRDGSRTVAAADATVNASGRWRTAVDATALDAGRYTLHAEIPEANDERTVEVGTAPTATAAPAGTPTPDSAGAGAATPTSTPTATPAGATGGTAGATERANRAETTGDGAGFGVGPALLTWVVACLVAAGRRR